MDKEQIREMLSKLHVELKDAHDVDDGDIRDLLHTLIKDIEPLLLQGQPEEQQTPLAQTLGDSLHRFEVSHPSLAASISSMLDALSSMGI